jgi:FtsP/CotA-like multicopper oxidase with cupredoxin domain
MTPPDPVRRRLLQAAAAGSLLGRAALARAQAAPDPVKLRAAPVRVALLGAPYPDTDVWAYNGTVPGPLLRLRQGDTLRVSVANGLDAPTTVHWHGLRLPNRMDGVPHVTQPPGARSTTSSRAPTRARSGTTRTRRAACRSTWGCTAC